jgi:hypothetical protein
VAPVTNCTGRSTMGAIDPPWIFNMICDTSTVGADPSAFHAWLVRKYHATLVMPHHSRAPAKLVM